MTINSPSTAPPSRSSLQQALFLRHARLHYTLFCICGPCRCPLVFAPGCGNAEPRYSVVKHAAPQTGRYAFPLVRDLDDVSDARVAPTYKLTQNLKVCNKFLHAAHDFQMIARVLSADRRGLAGQELLRRVRLLHRC